jgi:hypothetical protein
MTKRKSTGKKARFEVFKRDNFTCQYCGGRPPEAVLVVDHMTPVKLGGTNELINLITSCEPCNQGKAARPLTQIHPRPDADLMYLEVQQEIAELQRFQRSGQAKKQAIDQTISLIQQSFTDITDLKWQPHDQPLRMMLEKYDPSIVKDAIEALGRKLNYMQYQGEDIRGMQWVPYMWSVCKNMAKGDQPMGEITYEECRHAFMVIEGKICDGILHENDFRFLIGPQKSPYMKLWRDGIPIDASRTDAWLTDTACVFLDACGSFTPLGMEFITLLLSEKIDAPRVRISLIDSIQFDRDCSEYDKKWLEERSAA